MPREMRTQVPPRVEVVSSLLAQRLAHPPLGARASVERGVEVVIAENHVNRAAPSGWMERLVRLLCAIFGMC